jgi:DNA (cytosine-5)-methyltransferase 1/site-specific DNA-methyltransferase (adenine-specific)
MFTLHNGDCIPYMLTLPKKSIHLAFLDIPYGLGVADWDKQISGLEAFEIARSLLVDGGSIYATCTFHILDQVRAVMNVRRIISWCKPNLPLRKNMQDWEWSTEFVLWETTGEPRVFNKPHGEASRDYWRIHVENGFLNKDGNDHPARKPVQLLKRIIATSTNEGDTVLDPFMGSGTTGVAAVQLDRNFIGFEISAKHFPEAESRIKSAVLSPSFYTPSNTACTRQGQVAPQFDNFE